MAAHAYFVRPGPNEELRYSLRSLHVNVDPDADVWIIGDAPGWYSGPLIQGNRFGGDKQRNVYDNVRIIAEHPDLPDEVAVWNDDFFALGPVKVEMAYRCSLAEHMVGLHGWWRQSLIATQLYLLDEHGMTDPLSYELHRPFPIHRETMATILADAAHVEPMNPPQWRTLYGNLAGVGGVCDEDRKFSKPDAPAGYRGGVASTTDTAFALSGAGREIRATFPDPSPWERAE